MDDSSDILGGQLNIAKHGSSYSFSALTFTKQFLCLGAFTVAVLAYNRFYPAYKQYQEKRYRKQMRRRHGIPDGDHRPFNVAYAAAKQSRGRESGERSRSITTPQGAASAVPQRVAASFGQSKQRPSAAGARVAPNDCAPSSSDLRADQRQRASQDTPFEGPSGSRQSNPVDSRQSSANAQAHETDPYLYAFERFPPGHFIETVSTGTASAIPDGREAVADKPRTLPSSSSLYQPAFARAAPLARTESEIFGQTARIKRGLDADGVPAYQTESKRWHAEDDEMDDDVDQTAEWRESEDEMEVDRVAPAASKGKRGAKRVASLGEDSFDMGRVNREKRARRSHNDDDEGMTMRPRGKKRDRGSSFEEGSHADEDDEKPRRHRRRRVVSHHKKDHKKASEGSRGRKRGRDPESMESDEDSDSPSRHSGRHKRGKRASWDAESSDERLISNDPLCKGRHIGEEWEANGVHYKVGPNGQRLRQAFVKKSRSRFPMPQDSEHPDATAHIDVFVESWLTEEDYQTAKDKQELSWQQSPSRKSSPVDTSASEVPDTPTKGKNLLWESTAPRDMMSRKGSKQSVNAANGLRVNPLQPIQSVPNRRISTLQSASPQEGPKMLRHSKSYSKWEKQDLEAAAMAKLREKVKQENAPAPAAPAKVPTPALPALAPSTSSTSAVATNGTKATEPSTTAAMGAKSSPFSFGPPSGASETKPTSTISIPTLPTAASTEPTKPSSVPFPSGPAQPPKAPTFNPFGKPPAAPAAPAAAPTSSSSSSVPNFFSKPMPPAASNGLAANGTASNLFGTTGNKAAAAPTSQPFSWGAPPAPVANKTEEKPAPAPTSGAPSLLSRLGSVAPPQTSTTTPAAAAAPTPAAPMFSFMKPNAPAATTAPPAAAPAAAPQAAPKFSFGVTSNPTSSSSVPTTAQPAAAPFKSAFSFGGSQPVAQTTAAAPAAAPEPPKFSFGAVGGSSSGAPASTPALKTPPKDAAAAAKPMFSFATTTPVSQPTGNLFGNTTTPAGAPTAFSFGTTTPAGEPSKITSAFANTTTPAGEPKTSSIFGNTTTPAGAPPAPPGLFGTTTPKASSLFANTTTPAGEPKTSVFGNAQTTSLFGNTTTPAGAPPKAPIFGAPAGTSSTPLFGTASAANETPKANPAFGGAKSAFSFGTTGGTSAFAQPAANAAGTSSQAAQPAKSAFGAPAAAAGVDVSKTDALPKPSFSFGSGFGSTANGANGSNPFALGGSSTPAAGSGTSAIAQGSGAFGSTSTLGAASAFGSKPAGTQPTPNAFGFGTGGSAFSFGKTNTDSTQK